MMTNMGKSRQPPVSWKPIGGRNKANDCFAVRRSGTPNFIIISIIHYVVAVAVAATVVVVVVHHCTIPRVC